MTARTAIVTGGSRGIGAACVRALTAEGYRVAAFATTKAGAARADPALALACDVADRAAVARAVDATVDALGPVDVLVNNAGVAGTNSLDPGDDDALWDRIVNVNLHGTYAVTKRVLAHMPDGGRVVNVGSVLSLRGVPDQTAYCAAKHGVLGFTRALAHALGPRGITVNCVCPGWVRTDMAAQRQRELGLDEAALTAAVPLGRFLTPEEVADTVRWLCGEGARNVTGQAIPVDGGATA